MRPCSTARLAFAFILTALPLPALAADPLKELVPLLTVFAADAVSPGWDVAGIRCAGIFYAQDNWTQQHGGNGPTKALLDAAATGLELATQHRIGQGQSLSAATLSVDKDVQVVIALYLDRFARNEASGHPWNGDPDLRGDQTYCKAALR
jgi:hypothetical protein